ETRARVWVQLGFATVALREQRIADASVHLDAIATDDPTAQLETTLVRAYIASRVDEAAVDELLARAEDLVAKGSIGEPDGACFVARLVDHRAYACNHAGDHAAALALYETLPAADTHPFASYRRDAGLAYGLYRAGRIDEALAIAA